MNKTAKSSFTFGMFLVITGITGHFFDWEQAQIIILLGLVFEFFAAMVYIWGKLKQK
jgi:hypothetical protein